MTAVPVHPRTDPVEQQVDDALVRMLDTPGLAHLVTPDSSPALRLLLTGLVERTTAPHAGRPITVQIVDSLAQPIGSAEARLVVRAGPTPRPGPLVWAITHGLGTVAGGTHTEVSIDPGAVDPLQTHLDRDRIARLLDDLVRSVAREAYGTRWSFHYRPDEVDASVLAFGSKVRERIEVTAIELWSL